MTEKRFVDNGKDRYKWYILLVEVITNAFVIAVPMMALSMLMPEILEDLGLSVFQSGLIWGMSSVTVIFGSLFGGSLINRFGPKNLMIFASVTLGILGALRGFADGFIFLLIVVLVMGFFGAMLNLSTFMNSVLWFKPNERGFANGALTLGMAFGFVLSSYLSAAVFSPLLGGWRNVFFLYGAIAILIGLFWLTTRPSENERAIREAEARGGADKLSMLPLLKLSSIWLLGLGMVGNSGAIQGILGYLPIYLEGLGVSVADTGKLVSAFHISSMLFVLPLSFIAGKYIPRKVVLIASAAISLIGVFLMSVLDDSVFMIAIVVTGFVRDGFMANLFTSASEAKGVGKHHAGLAIGLMLVFMGVGNSISPPIGNSLAENGSMTAPIVFWAGLSLFSVACLVLYALLDNRADSEDSAANLIGEVEA